MWFNMAVTLTTVSTVLPNKQFLLYINIIF